MPQDWFAKNAPPQQIAPSAPPAQGWFAANAPGQSTPAAPQAAAAPGFFRSLLDSSGASTLGSAIMHPIDTTKNIGGFVGDVAHSITDPNAGRSSSNPITRSFIGMADNTVNNVKQGVQDYKSQGLSLQTRRDFGRAVPIVGPPLAQAQAYQDSGNTPAALGTLLGTATGLVAPEMLKGALPVGAKVLSRVGRSLQDSGATRMDTFLNGNKPLPVGDYTSNPGRSVLQRGPGTSVATSRQALTGQIAGAKVAAAPAIDAAAANAPGRLPIPTIRAAVDSTIDPMQQTARGPLGSPALVKRLDQVRASFEPGISQPGDISATDALALRRQLDGNINWNRGPDPIDASVRNAGRQIRGKLNSALYDAAPEVEGPSRTYAGLADAHDLSEANQGVRDVQFGGGIRRVLTDAGLGFSAGALAHSPTAGLEAAVATHVAPMAWRMPITQTGLATGAFQAGRALNAAAPLLQAAAPAVNAAVNAFPTALRLLPPASGASALTPLLNPIQNQKQGPKANGDYSNQQSQGAPPTNATSVLSRRVVVPPRIAPDNALGLSPNALSATRNGPGPSFVPPPGSKTLRPIWKKGDPNDDL